MLFIVKKNFSKCFFTLCQVTAVCDMSHISDMHLRYYPTFTTLRVSAACMVLIVPVGTSHASGMNIKMLFQW